mmetsp:Transcript_122075/g.380023  ORF Transcript_122075/g.380023 Transcript_122075/m.380023 type:complete len:161 (+) Transcript_122075:1-483(+)
MSRDASILAGAVPVVLELPLGMPRHWLPWAPILNWSDFSVNFTLTDEEAAGNRSFMPRLEGHLRALVASGEVDRLLRGVASVRNMVRWTEKGAVGTIMGMLAWHKAGMPEPSKACLRDGHARASPTPSSSPSFSGPAADGSAAFGTAAVGLSAAGAAADA